jgi:hypothetical protein
VIGASRIIEVPVGGIWEEADWEIHVQYQSNYGEPCPHRTETRFRQVWVMKDNGITRYREPKIVDVDDPILKEVEEGLVESVYQWPLVAVVHNQGDYDSAGLCILCLQEHLPGEGGE